MKQYPSIDGQVVDVDIYGFAKYDGSNIRAEWHPKKGFWKFGSRTRLVDITEPLGAKSIPLIKTQEESFNSILKELKAEKAICFFEFFGPSSFAGVHNYEEQGHQVVLIDVSVHREGFMSANKFVKVFEKNSSLPVAKCLYFGKPNQDFIKSVKDRTLEGMPFEGVVCKAPLTRKQEFPTMFKIKSNAWIDKVKSLYTDPEVLKELL